jgi:hypothetical protein
MRGWNHSSSHRFRHNGLAKGRLRESRRLVFCVVQFTLIHETYDQATIIICSTVREVELACQFLREAFGSSYGLSRSSSNLQFFNNKIHKEELL